MSGTAGIFIGSQNIFGFWTCLFGLICLNQLLMAVVLTFPSHSVSLRHQTGRVSQAPDGHVSSRERALELVREACQILEQGSEEDKRMSWILEDSVQLLYVSADSSVAIG